MCLALVQAADALSLTNPYLYIATAVNRPYYITMIPGGNEDGYGIAYRLNSDGSSTELWRMYEYSFEVYLAIDGVHLVTICPCFVGSTLSEDELAIEFFKNGELLESYSTKDLIVDVSKIKKKTMGEDSWQANDDRFPYLSPTRRFYLKTIEEITYIFDVTTGQIIDKVTP